MKIQLYKVLLLVAPLLVATQYGCARIDQDSHQHISPATISDLPGRYDSALRTRFFNEYQASGSFSRSVINLYLSTLGADGILDVFEQKNALCHAEAHDLGKEIFLQTKALGPGVQICGNRCSSGCMHGLLWQAFAGDNEHQHHLSLAEIKPKIKTFCDDKAITDTYEPGNCAHAVGHAITVVSGYELGDALQACRAFETTPLQYYCASGVFMEYDGQPSKASKDRSSHYPCDTYKDFPSACYKYRTRHFLNKANGNTAVVAEECSRLETIQRHACFYGLGAAQFAPLAKTPEQLGAFCQFGDAQDQAMCIYGAIEYLADLQPAAALQACETLTGENAQRCLEATRNKRYGLEKDFSPR